MIRMAERDFALDAGGSYVIGDKLSDIEFGKRAGCKTILVLTGHGEDEHEHNLDTADSAPDFVAADILEAAHWIVKDTAAEGRDSE